MSVTKLTMLDKILEAPKLQGGGKSLRNLLKSTNF